MSLVTMKAQPCTTKVTSVIMHETPQRDQSNPPASGIMATVRNKGNARGTSTVQKKDYLNKHVHLYKM